jgi:hypothetical protein
LYDAMKIDTSKVEPNVVWHSKGSWKFHID